MDSFPAWAPPQSPRRLGRPLAALILLLCLTGCLGPGRQYANRKLPLGPRSQYLNPVAFGGPRPGVDRLEKVVQAPRRLARRLRRSQPTESEDQQRHEAVCLAQEYLAANDLNDVYIDVRCYHPREQWRRLRENDRMGPLVKYTAGTVSVLGYTLLPRRALQSDSYDPFTNTLSINSPRPARALYEAASAKQFRRRQLPGAYAALQYAPLVPLAHHAQATSDVLAYSEAVERPALTRQLYPAAYGRLGSAVVSETLFFVPLPGEIPGFTAPLTRLAGRAGGALAGRAVARRRVPETTVR